MGEMTSRNIPATERLFKQRKDSIIWSISRGDDEPADLCEGEC